MSDAKKKHDAPASSDERRALDAEELALADQARSPTLGTLSDRALSDLVSLLRSRRNRARDIADRQGREARSKAAPSGATPAKSNAGTLTKLDYLNAALERATEERSKRGAGDTGNAKDGGDAKAEEEGGAKGDTPSQHDFAVKAMETKQAGAAGPSAMTEEGGPLHPDDPDASDGKAGLEQTARRMAPSGAFDHAGNLPSRERSRTRY